MGNFITTQFEEMKKQIKEEIRDEIKYEMIDEMEESIRELGCYDSRCEEIEERLKELEDSFENIHDKLELILKKILEKNTEGEEKEIIRAKRLTFKKDYLGKNIHIIFTDGDDTYEYPHNELLQSLSKYLDIIVDTQSWKERGVYHFPQLSKEIKKIMEQYKK